MRSFASDNFASVHPKVMQALSRANTGHSMAYGADPWSDRAKKLIQREFKTDCGVHFVWNGTGANVCALDACLRRHEAVICARSSHINMDEGGAPERILGCKLLSVDGFQGKLKAPDFVDLVRSHQGVHHVSPRVLSITQCTEVGTIYTVEEMAELGRACKDLGLYFHVDGARFYNAAVALGCGLDEISWKCGVDIMSLGGTKNGLMFGEAVLVFNPELSRHLQNSRKQSTQLASKMRFLAAQFDALFDDGLWRENATRSNMMASLLGKAIRPIPQIEVVYPVESTALFVKIPPDLKAHLLKDDFFWDWDEKNHIVRWMTSFDTQPEDIEKFIQAIRDFTG